MKNISKFSFLISCFSLFILSIMFIIYGFYSLFISIFFHPQNFRSTLVNSINYVVISMALFDVAKYFFEEEVINKRTHTHISDQRNALIKFITTICIAIFIEGLVGIFESRHTTLLEMMYPVVLLILAMLMVICLGIYQKLSISAQNQLKDK